MEKLVLHCRKWLVFGLVFCSLLLIICINNNAAALAADCEPINCVNPFIGTGAHGHCYPGATVPFGMVQLSPDTYDKGWDWCSGYHWSDNSLMGFSHTHLSGTGCGDLGDILFAATTGDIKLVPGSREHPESGYRSRFSHADEKASAGSYSVLLKSYDIKVELTATKHVGFHRYTFPHTKSVKSGNIIIDLSHGIESKPLALQMTVVGDNKVEGMRQVTGWAKNRYIYFCAEFSKPFKSFGTATDDTTSQSGNRQAQGTNVKGWFTFDTTDDLPVLVKVGISTASVEGAADNVKAEIPNWDFGLVKETAKQVWTENLARVDCDGGTEKERQTFYTALYHAMLAPTLISDVNGKYRGSDCQVHEATDFENYSTFSLWDTFRAEHPLLTILEPERVSDMLSSFLAQAQFHPDKTLPIWPLYANETNCMIGYHSFPVIAEAKIKGIDVPQPEKLLDYMIANSKRNDWWAQRGYIPADKESESVSKTLEFAYDDWALAQFGKSLGKDDVYKKYMQRSQAYKNVFDPQTKFMRGRLENGSWRDPFDPDFVSDGDKAHDFTEANSWQYTWFVPQDVPGLISLMGGRKAFVDKLDALFNHAPIPEPSIHDVTGLIGQYAQGNEPSHHVAYLYSYAGAPWKTQERVRQIRALYNETPQGLCGNEDCGQMSAWYVLSSLGLYPVNPVQATYVLGVPAFSRSDLTLINDSKFTILATDLSPENHYVDKVWLNGKPLTRVYITHKELMAGGTLEFVMTDKPSQWGTAADAAPPRQLPETGD